MIPWLFRVLRDQLNGQIEIEIACKQVVDSREMRAMNARRERLAGRIGVQF